ncbi:hypothetical protein ACLBV5_14540 [Brevundimonas sp. M1A4_2e]|uniref:hypothetical protein n=1 Tax=Brevundimonas naejangsanensis TaxID=588932 RepID=UPI000ED3B4A3|nr:hypothetical protein [Brevundimonas naejangsanensis]HCW49365.1 hypothetical protein [Brevundimonas sp.]
MRTVFVEPFGDVWSVRVDDTQPQLFARGREAENVAKRIAERLAAAGDQVELHLSLRNGQLAARFVCLPPISDDDRPLLVGGSLLARPALKRSADAPA